MCCSILRSLKKVGCESGSIGAGKTADTKKTGGGGSSASSANAGGKRKGTKGRDDLDPRDGRVAGLGVLGLGKGAWPPLKSSDSSSAKTGNANSSKSTAGGGGGSKRVSKLKKRTRNDGTSSRTGADDVVSSTKVTVDDIIAAAAAAVPTEHAREAPVVPFAPSSAPLGVEDGVAASSAPSAKAKIPTAAHHY